MAFTKIENEFWLNTSHFLVLNSGVNSKQCKHSVNHSPLSGKTLSKYNGRSFSLTEVVCNISFHPIPPLLPCPVYPGAGPCLVKKSFQLEDCGNVPQGPSTLLAATGCRLPARGEEADQWWQPPLAPLEMEMGRNCLEVLKIINKNDTQRSLYIQYLVEWDWHCFRTVLTGAPWFQSIWRESSDLIQNTLTQHSAKLLVYTARGAEGWKWEWCKLGFAALAIRGIEADRAEPGLSIKIFFINLKHWVLEAGDRVVAVASALLRS